MRIFSSIIILIAMLLAVISFHYIAIMVPVKLNLNVNHERWGGGHYIVKRETVDRRVMCDHGVPLVVVYFFHFICCCLNFQSVLPLYSFSQAVNFFLKHFSIESGGSVKSIET